MLANLIAKLTCLSDVHTFYVNWKSVDLQTDTVLLPYLFSIRKCRQEREKNVRARYLENEVQKLQFFRSFKLSSKSHRKKQIS